MKKIMNYFITIIIPLSTLKYIFSCAVFRIFRLINSSFSNRKYEVIHKSPDDSNNEKL